MYKRSDGQDKGALPNQTEYPAVIFTLDSKATVQRFLHIANGKHLAVTTPSRTTSANFTGTTPEN
jgi:hypothetical protein